MPRPDSERADHHAISTPSAPPAGGQDQRLGEQLPKQSATTRADRAANGELALSRGTAREQHVRHVGTGDEENEADRDEQSCARRFHIAVEHRVEADARHWHDAGDDRVVGRRIFLRQPRVDRLELRTRVVRRPAVCEAALHEQPSLAPPGQPA